MADLVLRPMRPMYRARGRRVWPWLAAGLLVAFALSQWFGGVYAIPPGEDGTPGRTALVWRADGEPFFNSPAVPGFEEGPAGRILADGLPFWSYAYRQSLRAAARVETVTVGAAAPRDGPAAVLPADGAAAERAARAPSPGEPEAGARPGTTASPRAVAAPASPARPEAPAAPAPPEPPAAPAPPARAARPAAQAATPTPGSATAVSRPAATPTPRPAAAAVRPVASPSATGVSAERDRRLERIHRELERIRRGGARSSSLGRGGPRSGG